MEVRIGGKFVLGRQIGSGSFGEVHVATNVETNEEVAVKLEPTSVKTPVLIHEAKLYANFSGIVGVPQVYWYGNEGKYNVMVMELLGPSLGDLLDYCDSHFSVRTTIMLAEQIITRLEQVHSRNYLHRDIKPENFAMGLGKHTNMVYILDFGLAKKYRNPQTQEHIPFHDQKALTGTAEYSSLNTHLGYEQSRRDDLESVGFMLFHFLAGSLPWSEWEGGDGEKEDKHAKIFKHKKKVPIEEMGKTYPPEFVTYVHYCRSLDFEDRPDYSFPRMILRDAFLREGYDLDAPFDWDLKYENRKIDDEARYGIKAEPTGENELAMKIRDRKVQQIERAANRKTHLP